ncbi:MAG: DUF7210 family protein [Candidatus Rokuibacteriota bacterium]
MTEVELIKPHTHAGVLHAPGETLELDEATARWLIDQSVARPLVLHTRTDPIEPIEEED